MTLFRSTTLPVLALVSLLAGCDMLGIETPEKRSGEGKAIGAACRHAGRAIEDCYTLNAKGDKSAIYAGWREMDDYMRENKLEPVIPVIKPEDLKPKPKAKPKPKPEGEGEDSGAKADAGADEKPAKKSSGH
ncbi:MAG: hypothetical protein CFE46_03110 [Burkholderiales bacterium PBB6]|nr:MAG: hypothetical protein CFE46_03110 [Burkholderiales bacterium PBB6]